MRKFLWRLLFILIALIPTQVLGFEFDQLAQTISQTSEVLNEDSLKLGLNIHIENCQTYPYYNSQAIPQDGNRVLANNLNLALNQMHQCLKDNQFTPYVLQAMNSLKTIIQSHDKKSLTCNYGVTNSFFAVASDPKREEQKHGLPPHPSVIFDTNRMAGNWNLAISDEHINNILLFYGDRIEREEIIPGTRNPFITKITNPTSLVLHEIFHWTGHSHYPKKNLDIVYLSQLCCFNHQQIDSAQQQRACDLLSDHEAWQNNLTERTEYLKTNELHKEVKGLIELYHK